MYVYLKLANEVAFQGTISPFEEITYKLFLKPTIPNLLYRPFFFFVSSLRKLYLDHSINNYSEISQAIKTQRSSGPAPSFRKTIAIANIGGSTALPHVYYFFDTPIFSVREVGEGIYFYIL